MLVEAVDAGADVVFVRAGSGGAEQGDMLTRSLPSLSNDTGRFVAIVAYKEHRLVSC